MLGVGILVSFTFMALAAPWITPHDPVRDIFVGGEQASPSWFTSLPGNEHLTENTELETEPGFPTAASLMDPDSWNFTASSAQIWREYNAKNGSNNLGSAAIFFSRSAGMPLLGNVEAHLTKEFQYPYNVPPKRFTCKIALSVDTIKNLKLIQSEVYIHRVEKNSSESKEFYLWSETFYEANQLWKTPMIDSYDHELKSLYGGTFADPAKIIFPDSTRYVYDIILRFDDSKVGTTGRNAEARVYIDDLDIKFYGSAYGLLGTDQWGRDVYSQLVWGARISLMVGLLSAAMSVIIGLAVGLVSGYVGRLADELMMRFTDMLLVLPGLPLLLVLIAVLGQSMWNVILLLGLLGWMGFARTIRAQVLTLRERPFVEAAKAVGAGKFHIIAKHVLPNVMSLVYVSLALAVPSAILSEAALSWLGLFDPSVMSWGRMLHDIQVYSGYEKWWWVLPPGICIAAASLSFILLGFALDEVLNPKLRRRR